LQSGNLAVTTLGMKTDVSNMKLSAMAMPHEFASDRFLRSPEFKKALFSVPMDSVNLARFH
jgi:hypothetical protein